MDIYYTNETLFVNLIGITDEYEIEKIKVKVFKILDDYGIINLELKTDNNKGLLLSDFISAYKKKYNGNLKIK